MRTLVLPLGLVLAAASLVPVEAQRRAAGGPATLAIVVTDDAGARAGEVTVTVTGPATRTARTEAGRIALEGLPAGSYLLRFEREGFVTLEREVTARAGKPTQVNVTLKPLPPPPAPPPKPPVEARPMFADLPALIEKEYVGRAPSRTSALACGAGATSTLIQLNEPLATHAHADADEIFYVVAGEGNARVGTGEQRLKAGMFLFVPRGMSHALTPTGRNPLIVLSTRAGEPCGV
ncbi:MAG TPA: carboxypeptidase regulatory-like domain-containing protein [Vicinamibacterales bacterium]|nr:carboxypeptidase regulatory-like domain-containing protein [Vicinamibacterales bacterium]